MIWVALGGVVGALLRYGTNILADPILGSHTFITATAIENILGSFLMGFFFTILLTADKSSQKLNLFLLTGLLGSYTTYSGFSVEAFGLLSNSVWIYLSYIGLQVIAGIAALFLGIKTAAFVNREAT